MGNEAARVLKGMRRGKASDLTIHPIKDSNDSIFKELVQSYSKGLQSQRAVIAWKNGTCGNSQKGNIKDLTNDLSASL